FDKVMDFAEGLAAVRVGDKWGYVDESGAVAIEIKFEQADSFSEGRAVVAMGHDENLRFGFIDTTGTFVVAPRFREARVFHEGLARVTELGDLRIDVYVDGVGHVAFTSLGAPSHDFSEGFARIEKDG